MADDSWSCPNCTFFNHNDLLVCEMCDLSLVSTLCSPKKTSDNIHVKILEKSTSIDIIEHLKLIIGNNCFMANTLCLHYSQKNAYGARWSCGYRNIQMLCSALINIETYRTTLFNGDGVIPTVPGIQKWIEAAWAAGFDTAGGGQFGFKLHGSTEWIGATECAALLRFFRIRAVIVDIQEKSGDNEPGEKRKFDGAPIAFRIGKWMNKYFGRIKNQTQINSTNQAIEKKKDEKKVIDLTKDDHFSITTIETGVEEGNLVDREMNVDLLIPPVYLQHQGHSRTVIGTLYNSNNKENKEEYLNSLLILDPGQENNKLINSLLQSLPNNHNTTVGKEKGEKGVDSKKWENNIRVPLSKLKHGKYQIVYIIPGLMSKEEQERSKLLVGISDEAELLTHL